MERTINSQRTDFLSAGRSWWRCGFLALLICLAPATPVSPQDWFRTGTGLGVAKPRVAVADFAPRTAAAEPLAALFSEVLRNDLDYSGILELVSKSFHPLQSPSLPGELTDASWSDPPASAQFLAFGNLPASGNDLSGHACFHDFCCLPAPPNFGQVYRGPVSEPQVR